jgi:hypothetical protein
VFCHVGQGHCEFDQEVAVVEGTGRAAEPALRAGEITVSKVAACQQTVAPGNALVPAVGFADVSVGCGESACRREVTGA